MKIQILVLFALLLFGCKFPKKDETSSTSANRSFDENSNLFVQNIYHRDKRIPLYSLKADIPEVNPKNVDKPELKKNIVHQIPRFKTMQLLEVIEKPLEYASESSSRRFDRWLKVRVQVSRNKTQEGYVLAYMTNYTDSLGTEIKLIARNEGPVRTILYEEPNQKSKKLHSVNPGVTVKFLGGFYKEVKNPNYENPDYWAKVKLNDQIEGYIPTYQLQWNASCTLSNEEEAKYLNGLNDNTLSLLEMTAAAEGVLYRRKWFQDIKNPYQIQVGYHRFFSCHGHPEEMISLGSSYSNAAGKFQLLSTFWTDMRDYLRKFDSKNKKGFPYMHTFNRYAQNRATLAFLYEKRHVTKEEIKSLTPSENPPGEFVIILEKMSEYWASFPLNARSQKKYTCAAMWKSYLCFLSAYKKGTIGKKRQDCRKVLTKSEFFYEPKTTC